MLFNDFVKDIFVEHHTSIGLDVEEAKDLFEENSFDKVCKWLTNKGYDLGEYYQQLTSHDVYLIGLGHFPSSAVGIIPFQSDNNWYVKVQYATYDDIYRVLNIDELCYVSTVEDEDVE